MADFDSKELDSYINETAGIEPDQMGSEGGNNADGTGNADNASGGKSTPDTGVKTDAGGNVQTVSKQPQKVDSQEGKLDAQGKPIAATPALRPLRDGSFADKDGNIVDKDGKIVAQAGFAARIHNKAQRLEQRNAEMETSLTQLRSQLSDYKVLSSAAQAKGLTSDDMAVAFDFAGRIKSGDALGVAKEVVAMAVAAGHNVTEILGKDVGDSIDMRGIRAMIDERLGPLAEKNKVDTQATELDARVRAAYNKFVDENEFADVHADDIAFMIKEVPGTSPQQAYNTMVRFAHANGLDFAQPFGPQLEAKAIADKNNGGNNNQQRQDKPLLNGANGSHMQSNGANTTELAPADSDWSTIIRQAMGSA